MVGFAAETEQLHDHARGKLSRKNLDFVIANDVSRSDIGFNSDMNHVSVIDPQGTQELPIANKRVLAAQLIRLFANRLDSQR